MRRCDFIHLPRIEPKSNMQTCDSSIEGTHSRWWASRSGMSDERPACSSRRDARGAVEGRLDCGEVHECQPPCHKLWKPFFWYRLLLVPGGPCMSQPKKSANPKVTIIASKGANQAINYLLEDRDELEWLVAIGRNHKGDIFFYDTGGDIIQDLGALEYIKERILRDYFGETDE